MPVLMASFLEPRSSLHLEPATAFPSGQKGQRLRLRFRGYIWLRFRCNPQVCSAHFLGLCQGTLCFGLPLAPPSSYMGELPNSHGRTLTDKSYVIHGILSRTGKFSLLAIFVFPLCEPCVSSEAGERTCLCVFVKYCRFYPSVSPASLAKRARENKYN
jgi:hypothetical protein